MHHILLNLEHIELEGTQVIIKILRPMAKIDTLLEGLPFNTTITFSSVADLSWAASSSASADRECASRRAVSASCSFPSASSARLVVFASASAHVLCWILSSTRRQKPWKQYLRAARCTLHIIRAQSSRASRCPLPTKPGLTVGRANRPTLNIV